MSVPFAANAEWLEADGLGGFASGTVSGIRTRRYHAILLAAIAPPAQRMVLVNGFDAEVEVDGVRTPISSQRYVPGAVAPDGAQHLEKFAPEPWPCWTYAVPAGRITQEIFVPKERAAVVLRWRWEGSPGAKLRVRPFFSGRDFHATHHENGEFRFRPLLMESGPRWSFYADVPPVSALTNGVYQHEAQWYRHFLYEEEEARGLDAVEDLAAPGYFLFDLQSDAVLTFAAEGLGAGLPIGLTPLALANHLTDEERTRRAAFATPRLRAADAYLVRRGDGKTIIAGYPWFGDWGRDTFIAMRGLCLAAGRLDEARDILHAWAGTVSEGMLPNRFPDSGSAPEYNSVDASLWYVIDVHEFLDAAQGNDKLLADADRLHNTVEAILSGFTRGTRYGIHADADGLLACGEPGWQLTWMDAKVGDHVITPRIGKPVEVQALWLNALGLAARHNPAWREPFDRGCAAFRERFWNEAQDGLYDVIDVDHKPGACDATLRPNQIFAVGGLPIRLLEGDRARRVVQTVEDALWTPMGPRSLAPGDPAYVPHYVGSPSVRDAAYHQGTVWPWVAGPFVEAWLNVRGNSAEAKRKARELFLQPRLLRGDLVGLGHVPEIADADPAFTGRGCPFQAWSLGEIMRLEKMLG
jgi:predicted glycogen debranching enzyme